MKKYFFISLILFFIMACSKNSNDKETFDKKQWIVSSRNNLEMKEQPTSESKTLKELVYGEFVVSIEKTAKTDLIDGIKDYWHKIGQFDFENYQIYYGWVFGGYLSEKLDDNLIVGTWHEDSEPNDFDWTFFYNGHYDKWYCGKGEASIGEYKIQYDTLTIIRRDRSAIDGSLGSEYNFVANIKFIDDDHMILTNISNKNLEESELEDNKFYLIRK